MKKICALMVCMTVCGAALFAQAPETDFTTEAEGAPNGDGVVITGYQGKGGDVVIPAVIGGKTVVGIVDYAFAWNESLVSVTIPAGVTTIDKWVFSGCNSLKAISVAAANRQYKDIDGVVFSKDGKTLLIYPVGGKTDYTVPAGVTTIGDNAFEWCESLSSVTIPAGVTAIGVKAFDGCESLTAVTIPDSVTSIGDYAFGDCKLKPEVAADIEKRFGEGPLTSPW
jgi:hypothetical protein